VEAARALAARTLREAPAKDAARLRYAFRLVTAREAAADELQVLRQALARQRATYSADRQAAAALLRTGESPAGARWPAPELAAWASVCHILLNLDEAVTKE
jgi:hypothetical protein